MSHRRKKRTLKIILDGLEIHTIKWGRPTNRFNTYKGCLKKDPCVYCGKPSESWEHVQPRSKDGRDGWSNIARACLDCNGKRGNTPFLLFMLSKGAS